MSRLDIQGGDIEITTGARKVWGTDGVLVNLLPPAFDYTTTITVAFPDFTKDYAYNWWWTIIGPVASQWSHDNGCTTQVTIPPQEWEETTVLAAAPAGADIFLSRVRITRTGSPTHAWGGSTVQMLPPSNVWLPFSGSVLMEAELGMARAFSLYLSGGNLVLHRQQSVANPPGGFGEYGSWTPFGNSFGGEWVFGVQPGIPVVPIQSRDSDPNFETNKGLPKGNHRRGGGDACSTNLATNFASTYQVEIVGKFGRRS